MSNKKRIVVLAGAGAVIDWGAPTTDAITKLILNDKSFISADGKPLGLYLFDKLKAYYYLQPELINFETILNCIEDLYSYFSSKYRTGVNKYKNNKPLFFDLKDDFYWDILDFDRIYKKDVNQNKYSAHHTNLILLWNDYDEFFRAVYKKYLHLISQNITSYCTKEKIEDLKNYDLNSSLKTNIEKHTNEGSIVRYYTLNYDKLPIFAGGINFFEGFNNDSTFDLNRVLTDYSVNCYYNLHGSLYYKQEGFNNLTLSQSPQEIYSTGNTVTQEGDTSLCSNIITGLKKSSLILNQPYFSFYNSFIYDFINADEIHFVGYSFSDVHINKVFDYPTKAEKIIVIDYIHDYKDLSEDFFPYYETNRVHKFLGGWPIARNIGDAMNREMLQKTNVYIKGYKSFLQNQI